MNKVSINLEDKNSYSKKTSISQNLKKSLIKKNSNEESSLVDYKSNIDNSLKSNNFKISKLYEGDFTNKEEDGIKKENEIEEEEKEEKKIDKFSVSIDDISEKRKNSMNYQTKKIKQSISEFNCKENSTEKKSIVLKKPSLKNESEGKLIAPVKKNESISKKTKSELDDDELLAFLDGELDN